MRAAPLVIRLAIVAIAFSVAGCDTTDSNPIDPSQANIEFTTTDLVVGTGDPAGNGSVVTVNYTGWLFDASGTESKGRQFVSTTTGAQQLVTTIGRRQTLPGVEQALIGMRLGGRRRVYVPANLGYGSSGTQDGSVPPNAALVFELDMVDLVP